MITIGGRTQACNANPGFSVLELKEEAKRRGIEYKFNTPRHELISLLCVPNSEAKTGSSGLYGGKVNVMYHRNFGASAYGNSIFLTDFDEWKEPRFRGFHNAEMLGVLPDGRIFFYQKRREEGISYREVYEELESSAIAVPERTGFEIVDVYSTTATELESEAAFKPPVFSIRGKGLKVVGISNSSRIMGAVKSKLIYIENFSKGIGTGLKARDFTTGKTIDLFTGNFHSVVLKNNLILFIHEDKPPNFILMDNTGKTIWKEPEETFGRFVTPELLLDSKNFIGFGGEEYILFTFSDGTRSGARAQWKQSSSMGSETHNILGTSKGRFLLSNRLEVNVYDIEREVEEAEDTGERFLFRVAFNPFEDMDSIEKKVEGEEFMTELHDGRIVYSDPYTAKTFVIDLDAGTVSSPHDYSGKYFVLPPAKEERDKFIEVILSSSDRINKDVAEIIERFI